MGTDERRTGHCGATMSLGGRFRPSLGFQGSKMIARPFYESYLPAGGQSERLELAN
jgi:hypothetical protein